MPLSNISRKNIGELIYEQFMDAIRTEEWKAGEKIPSETELANTLHVSRMSVRTALQRLSALGLIESRQGEGTYVCEFTGAQYANSLVPLTLTDPGQMENLMEFRMILECEIAALAAKRADDEIIAALKENYRLHSQTADDTEKSAALDAEFHYTLARGTNNPLIIQVYSVFMKVFEMNMNKIVSKMGITGAMKFHGGIIDAIEQRDPVSARQIMNEHLEDTIRATIGENSAE